MGARLPFFWASWQCGPAGWLAKLLIKAGDVETNPGPTTSRKQVWICDICHRQIQVRKPISIRCNSIEHWVNLRCTGIRLAQYTDTSTRRIQTHNKHRLNMAHAAHSLPPNTTHTTTTKTQTHIPLSPCSSRIGKA